ncbi:MAG: tRNA uridine-5-carboxymethylaminomethyl(34) synthesis GTPase MnmE [Thermodesulfobacteriota bacterium]
MGPSLRQFADTIVAVSTPRGYSGIGVIRLSGPDAVPIARRVFRAAKESGEWPDRRALYGYAIDPDSGKILDDGIALTMRGPASYTGEDVVELSLHGSPMVLDMITHHIVRMGARPAERGEFTRRAFLSGRMDLVQAEAVIDLIEATSPLGVEEARSRLDRSLSREIGNLSTALRDLAADIDAYTDFDEDDEQPPPEPEPRLRAVLSKMEELLADAASGKIRREGVKTVIVGKPNVGKSTLFNLLLRSDRMIVTPYPGTTRDPVEERLVLDGTAFALWDTAGIRKHPETVEAEGIRRTVEQMISADLVLAVFDGSNELDDEDREVLEACREKEAIIVVNKIDLGTAIDPDSPQLGPRERIRVSLSAMTGTGLDSLVQALQEIGTRVTGSGRDTTSAALSLRGVLLVESAAAPLRDLVSCMEAGELPGPEIVSLEVRRSLQCLEEVTGERVDEAILDRIFERFCVGK